ncbi:MULTISPECIES: hypothetical protein [unclassified Haladaptatus]|uniref:hypothetical protein n=1 Tax=unclassified Haladaptatus TaxID=2622732 RepID=UPI0023E82E91|nr:MULTISPECIES: hypothetical protein [unclassified Haladaptatus]
MSIRQAIAFPRLIIVACFVAIILSAVGLGMQVESAATLPITDVGLALGTICICIALIHNAYTNLW